MYAIPPGLQAGGSQVTGVSCPDCRGVLNVQVEGREATLVFECRIGHTFDVSELVAAKEERLEEYLWAANTVLEELTVLLSELAEVGPDHGEPLSAARAYEERAVRARRSAAALRAFIRDTRPVDLAPEDPGKSRDGGRRASGIEPGAGPGGS
jgi:hypothetical protein